MSDSCGAGAGAGAGCATGKADRSATQKLQAALDAKCEELSSAKDQLKELQVRLGKCVMPLLLTEQLQMASWSHVVVALHLCMSVILLFCSCHLYCVPVDASGLWTRDALELTKIKCGNRK
jgi:hypothetical protein